MATAGVLGMLTTNLQARLVSETTVGLVTGKAFKLETPDLVEIAGVDVNIFTSLQVFLFVDKPHRDAELKRILDYFSKLFLLLKGNFTSTHVWVDAGSLADGLSETAANTLYLC